MITHDLRIPLVYAGNGVTVAFDVPWPVLEDSELFLTQADGLGPEVEVPVGDYAVTGVGNPTATVTLATPPGSGATLRIYPDVPALQLLNLRAQGEYNPERIEAALDTITKLGGQALSQHEFYAMFGTRVPLAPIVWAADGSRRLESGDTALTGDMLLRGHLADTAPGKGGALVAFKQAGAGTASRTVQDKLLDAIATIMDFGAVADGVTDDVAAVQLAEASAFPYIDLCGRTVNTTVASSAVAKRYFNGTLLVVNSNGNAEQYKPASPLSDYAIARPRTKSPEVDWVGKSVLWLGTSIPHQGAGVDSYPDLFARALGCTVDNKAWSGSAATYNFNDDPMSIATVKRLSMTEADRLAGLALYGPTSAYDNSFDLVTKAQSMTADARISDSFAATPFDVVVLDHNHNDRRALMGTFTPESTAIASIGKGVTTSVTLASAGTIAVGDAVALEVTGIDYLHHAAGRVQSRVGNTITLAIDSSAYAGTFTAGTCYKLDRMTLAGAWSFLIHYIKNAGIRNGKPDVKIILAGAPSEYTGGVPDNAIFAVGRKIKTIADQWGLAFFDIGYLYDMDLARHPIYFPDNTHPTTTATRQALANHWIQWARGGAPKPVIDASYLPAGKTTTYTTNREALYSEFDGGFTTPGYVVGSWGPELSDDFFDGNTTGWTIVGTAAVVVAAPWGGGGKAAKFVAPAGGSSSMYQGSLTLDNGVRLTCDLWLPEVSGLIASGSVFVPLVSFNSVNTARYSLSAVVRSGGVSLSLRYMNSFGGSFITIPLTQASLDAATKYTLELTAVKATATYPGGIMLKVNGVRVSAPVAMLDSAWAGIVDRVSVGASATGLAVPFTAYIGNVVVQSAPINDYSGRYTGTFTTTDGKTVTVVNGIITKAV
jgi:hypothetical protein